MVEVGRIELPSCLAFAYLHRLLYIYNILDDKSQLNTFMKHKHHIIPRHVGGSDNPINLVLLTPEEHAEAHKKLYEEYGRWQDYVAWQGLAKLAEKKDLVKIILSEAGKKGAMISNANWSKERREKHSKYMKLNRTGAKNPCAKTYEITYPNGSKEIVKSLKTWCEEKEFNYNTFHVAIGRGHITHGGFTGKKIK